MKLNLKIVAAMSAVAMMSTGAAHAAVLTATPASAAYSLEGLQLSGNAAITIPTVTIVLQQNLTYQDDLFVTITGANTATATPPTFDCTDGNGVNPLGTGFTTGYVAGGSSGNTWNFRVTDQQGATSGEACVVSGLTVTAASLAASGSAEVAFTARRFILNQVIDQGSTLNLAVVTSQFSVAVGTALDATIDVFQDRLYFDDAIGSDTDTLVFTTRVDLGLPTFLNQAYVNATSTTVTIGGEFYWVDADGDSACEIAEFNAAIADVNGTVTLTNASDCTKLVMTVDAPNAAGAQVHELDFVVPGDIVLSPIDFTGSVLFAYQLNAGVAAGQKTLNFDPGAWGINGAQVYIQYMPYGDNVSRIIYVANDGALNAEVEVDAFDDEGNSYSFSAGNAAGNTVTQLSGVIDAGLLAEGFDGSGKVAMTLTFTAPDKDIEVYSAYNVGGSDRGTVVNTSNGRTFFYGTGVTPIP
ncbi:MAG: hypothetical protein NDI84_08905 [Steroidobacteraceae bacterium]|nr:hypothetical protein [Steroidobacteraceae bacterium]